jgi:hypothetical protein
LLSRASRTSSCRTASRSSGRPGRRRYQFLVPALAVVLAAVFLDEPIRAGQIVGGVVIVAGVLLTRWQPRRGRQGADRPAAQRSARNLRPTSTRTTTTTPIPSTQAIGGIPPDDAAAGCGLVGTGAAEAASRRGGGLPAALDHVRVITDPGTS